MIRCDFHVHTNYTDGKNTPAEVAAQAFADGLEILGFSEHSYLPIEDFSLSPEKEVSYRREIAGLQAEYRGRMKILLGLEKDLFSQVGEQDFDYVIGSVHYIKQDGELFPVDRSPESASQTIELCFGGDPYAYARAYFSQVAGLFDSVKADIIGHFDLLTKYNEKFPVFDLTDRRYVSGWTEAVEALIPHGKPFEINTGAMARKWRATPYPAVDMLKFIREKGGYIILSSDSHAKDTLRYRFDLTRELALSCGFTTQLIPTGQGLEEIPL